MGLAIRIAALHKGSAQSRGGRAYVQSSDDPMTTLDSNHVTNCADFV